MKLPCKHHRASWLKALRGFERSWAAKSILAFLCQQLSPFMMMSLLPLSACEEGNTFPKLWTHDRSASAQTRETVHTVAVNRLLIDECIKRCRMFDNVLSWVKVQEWLKVSFDEGFLIRYVLSIRSRQKQTNSFKSFAWGNKSVTLVSMKVSCKLNPAEHTQYMLSHAIARFVPRPWMTSLFSPSGRNIYDAGRRILLGATFEPVWRGIRRRAQQTTSRLSTWEETKHLASRWTLCCLG